MPRNRLSALALVGLLGSLRSLVDGQKLVAPHAAGGDHGQRGGRDPPVPSASSFEAFSWAASLVEDDGEYDRACLRITEVVDPVRPRLGADVVHLRIGPRVSASTRRGFAPRSEAKWS